MTTVEGRERASSTAVPANAQQAGIWFIHQLDPHCAAYHLVFAAEATADARLGARAAGVLTDLMHEYDALRVAFEDGGHGPVQYVAESVALDIRLEDARDTDAGALRGRIRADTRLAFDLSRPPLWRVHLYRTGTDTWVFAVVVHHAVSDFWTLALLLREVRSRLEGRPGDVVLDGTAFAAYAEQQAAFLAGGRARTLLESERGRLSGASVSLDLHGDAPRPPVSSYDGGSVPFALSPRATAAVQQLARDTDTTPYMLVLTAYFVMLSRLSGQPDILIGSPTAGRVQRSLRDAVGNFVNTVVVRGQVDEELAYRELVLRTRERTLQAMRAQELPFPWLVRELAPARDPSRTPLYQAGFAWDRLPFLGDMGEFFLLEPGVAARMEVAGAVLRPFPVPQQEGQTDLWIEMGVERDGAYAGVLRYNTDIWTPATGRELAATFVSTVQALAAEPDTPLRSLGRCDDRQRASISDWGTGPVRELPAERLPELVRQQAGRTPTAPAVVAGEEEWSYSRLIAEVEDVAAALRSAGVTAGDRVAVMTERGASLVAALLGVLAAGAAYVPLDPSMPADRLAYMAEDSGCRLLLSRASLRGSWPAGLPALVAEDLAAGVSGGASAGLPEDTDDQRPADLAYVIYTSGSTGRPKGVAIPHRALVNLLLGMRERTGFGSGDGLLAVTTISFDIAGLELFLPLVSGGRVIVCDSAATADGAVLATRIQESGATWMQATPTSWRMLRDAGWQGDRRLNVLCGGEELPPDLAGFLAPRTAALINVYGPTETTIWSTAGAVTPSRGVDIGRPIANTQIHVLDPYCREVEPGQPGELWIGGDGLALGYWNRPELTAERFVTGLPAAPGRRLYRTGDRARWTSDGRLLHLGRLDHQVKLHGYRIELGEVEAVLRAADGVSVAVVVVRDDRLVGYLVADPGVELRIADVKEAAAKALPPYMVPGFLMVLDELPLTANGKVDRNRLPAPSVPTGAEFEPPRDAVEIRLTRMWTEILGIPQVGIRDNFFDVGGHSLLAVRLGAAVRAEWGVEVPVSELVRRGTIAELAAVVRNGGAERPDVPVVVLREGTGVRPLFLFHPIGGTVLCYVELTRHLPAGRPVLAVEAPGVETLGEAEVSVEEMAERYVRWIRDVQPTGPYALGGWCFGGLIAYEVAGLLQDAGERIELLVALDGRAPIEANMPETVDDFTILSWFARDLAVPVGKTFTVAPDLLRDLGADAAFDHILDRATEAGIFSDDADRGQILRYFEAYLANGIALQTYLPEPRDIDMLLLRARDEPVDYGPALGWDALVKGELTVAPVPGDHNSIMYPPQAAVAAGVVAPYLESPR